MAFLTRKGYDYFGTIDDVTDARANARSQRTGSEGLNRLCPSPKGRAGNMIALIMDEAMLAEIASRSRQQRAGNRIALEWKKGLELKIRSLEADDDQKKIPRSTRERGMEVAAMMQQR